MSGITAYTPCKICSCEKYSNTFECLDKITNSITKQNISETITRIEEIAQTCQLENHAVFFRFKFENPEQHDQYWQAVKVKARNPESVVNTLAKSRVVAEYEFGIRREVFLKEDSTNTPRGENVFIDEEHQSVLFVVKPPEGFSIATNKITLVNSELYYQGAYFYLRHRDPIKEQIVSIHKSVFENIQYRVADGSMRKLYAQFYTNPVSVIGKQVNVISKIHSYLTPSEIATISRVSKYFLMKAHI